MGDFNIDVKEVTSQSLEKLNTSCEIFSISNIVKGYTCYSETHNSSIDLILINKMSSFQLTKAIETDMWCASSNFYIYENTNYSTKIEEVFAQGL